MPALSRRPRATLLSRLLPVALLTTVAPTGCTTPSAAGGSPLGAQHGRLTELSRVEGPIVLCEHRVPEKVCTRCHPELAANFQRAKDWCAAHDRPESQCLECHPDLTFEPLPRLPEGADVQQLSAAGEDVPDLAAHVVRGKVTVFDFYADWCAACRKVDGHVYERLAAGDTTLAYRRLNVVDWESPLAQRYLQQVPQLPLLVVYGPDGTRLAELSGADLEALDRAIAKGAR